HGVYSSRHRRRNRWYARTHSVDMLLRSNLTLMTQAVRIRLEGSRRYDGGRSWITFKIETRLEGIDVGSSVPGYVYRWRWRCRRLCLRMQGQGQCKVRSPRSRRCVLSTAVMRARLRFIFPREVRPTRGR